MAPSTESEQACPTGDPEYCDCLILLTTLVRHVHHPLGVTDDKIAPIHVGRLLRLYPAEQIGSSEPRDMQTETLP